MDALCAKGMQTPVIIFFYGVQQSVVYGPWFMAYCILIGSLQEMWEMNYRPGKELVGGGK